MKKWVVQVALWGLVVGALVGASGTDWIEADPTDDLSLTLNRAPAVGALRLMTEPHVAAILADHLDPFPRSEATRLAHHLLALCQYYRFDPAFVLSLIQVESGFKVKAVSPVNALGLMQVMPATARFIAHEPSLKYAGTDETTARALIKGRAITPRMLLDPYMNLSLGIAYLAHLRDYYQGEDPYYLVAAYNIGPGRMDELRARKHFRPTGTKKYYLAIRKGVPLFRHYRSNGEMHP